jgi:hypothetical protein
MQIQRPRIKGNNFAIFRSFSNAFVAFLILMSCSDVVETTSPITGPVTLQLHNFNSIDSKVSLGTAPYIHYFIQKPDSSFNFTLSADVSSSDKPYEIDWANEYIFYEMSNTGVITSTYAKDFNAHGGFESISFNYNNPRVEMPSKYEIVNDNLLYLRWEALNHYQQTILNLNPASGVAKSFVRSFNKDPYCDDCLRPYLIHPTSNGNILSINQTASGFDYTLLNENGISLFNQSIYYSNDYYFDYANNQNYFSHFITERDDEYFFINYLKDRTQNYWYQLRTDSYDYFYLSDGTLTTDFSIEVRIGDNYLQKGYLYRDSPNGEFIPIFKDFIDVPFELWDVKNNRQLVAGFIDRNVDDVFDNGDVIFVCDLDYSPTAIDYPLMMVPGGVVSYLAHTIDANWSGPPTTLEIVANYIPQGLVKINSSGFSEINANIFPTSLQVENIYDIVQYNDGFAVMCNASFYANSAYLQSQLILLKSNFDVDQIITLSEGATVQEKLVSNGDALLYGGIKNNTTLQLAMIKNGVRLSKDLTDLAQYSIESFKATPTLKKGWAILAWVWHTPSTRDLLFIELDENLNLVKN